MQSLSYYTATIHTPTATKYASFSGLSEVYAYLGTIGPYLYADIRCNGTLIHHKCGPSVPTCAPHAPHMRPTFPAGPWKWIVDQVKEIFRKIKA